MKKQEHNRSGSLNPFASVLAFVLSASMSVGFVLLVNKMHEVFADAVFEENALLGKWEGKLHDVPSVTVTVERKGEALTGTVVFQPLLKTEGGPKPAGRPVTLPLKDARFDGRTLRFKVDDNLAAPDLRESGIEMTLTGFDQAELKVATAEASDYEQVLMTKTA